MARKKRKTGKPSRKQLKQQRRKTMVRKREERSRSPRQAASERRHAEVIEDMLPLFTGIGDTSSGLAMEQFMKILLASADMVGEPEFEEIFVDPMGCVDTLAQVGEELGVDPGSLGDLAAENREDIKVRMIEETTQRLLTDELRRNIINALNDLRQRLKQSGKQEEAARAAILQAFLKMDNLDNAGELWSMIGLVQAVVQRSLAVGFDMLEASREVWEPESPGGDDIPLEQKLSQTNIVQKADMLLKKVPGLRGFMGKQADNTWEEGINALAAGDLYLGLFSLEELGKVIDISERAFGYQFPRGMSSEESLPLKVSKEQAATFVSLLDGYITELFTQDRLDQLRKRLDTIMKGSVTMRKWSAFIYMLSKYMASEDALENEKPFLLKAFLGELSTVGEVSRKANG